MDKELGDTNPTFERGGKLYLELNGGSGGVAMKRPKCKCGLPCAYYGPVGGFSKSCKVCNAYKAKLSAESRKRMKKK
jgi:hypothetical protein